MRNLLLLISKYNAVFFFIVLEVISLYLIVNYNNKQKDIFLYSSNLLVGKINNKHKDFLKYLNLEKINEELKKKDALIIQNYFNGKYKEIPNYSGSDSISNQYQLIPATICNKSIDKRNNRITLDVGSNVGIEKGMGVLSASGIVGVVKKVNEEFSSVIPLNNTVSRVSVSIKNSGYFGVLKWNPYDYRRTILTSVPKHAIVEVGDTIITSGFSTIFPKGIFVGKIEKVDLQRGSNYFDITVKLVNNLALEQDIYVIGNRKKNLKLDVLE